VSDCVHSTVIDPLGHILLNEWSSLQRISFPSVRELVGTFLLVGAVV